LHSSAALLHASAISRLICITTTSMLRLTTMSRLQRASMPDRCVSVMAAICHQFIDIVLSHQLGLLLHQPQLQHLGLDCDVGSIGLTARRLLPFAPQVSQVSNAAQIEREAVTLPLNHAFGFELIDVGPAAIEVPRQCGRADGHRPTGGRHAVTVPGMVLVLLPLSRDRSSAPGGIADHAPTCRWLNRSRMTHTSRSSCRNDCNLRSV